ncbi:KAP P-loop domain-containing protein [Candidatus Nitrosoglobus terrae]|uniref:KAP P-loop domain-containing protein n=1 Tax=Candidatus Nitrosoglobus terrae TaxID=1630141 RepID=A0A1Q2SKW3_9GAMM|nr:P-loop NTPase fold protein [Candidatus Nitrosoglobus terrae]BAW79760.1 KAP P-loop domain-containing protein [Candidatus Nitrosoglobus terrae]
MRITTPPLDIQESHGFKNDLLQRKQLGESLTNLVINSTEALVISLNSQWGEGKTTFVKMWQGLLKEQNIHSIYIDAFQNDHTDDAFILIVSAISSYADRHAGKNKIKKFKKIAIETGKHLIPWAAKTVTKAFTFNLIDNEGMERLLAQKNIVQDTSEAVGGYVKERLETHTKKVELIEAFKKSLSELPSKLENNTSAKLVIIIDELDRCRLSFAIEIIEKIKHFFSIEHIIFVLAMHRNQLEGSIKHIYGKDIDAYTYLQKFISVEATLPPKFYSNYDHGSYIQRLIKLHEIPNYNNTHEGIVSYLIPLVRHFEFSLRQIEKVFTNLAIIYGISNAKQDKSLLDSPALIVFISAVRVKNSNLFERLQKQNITFKDLWEGLKIAQVDFSLENLRNWVRFGVLSEEEFCTLSVDDPARKVINHYNIREKIIPLLCQRLSMFQ